MLQKYKPIMAIPDGWDLPLLSLADECPDLYANSKPTKSEDPLAYNRPRAFTTEDRRWIGRNRAAAPRRASQTPLPTHTNGVST